MVAAPVTDKNTPTPFAKAGRLFYPIPVGPETVARHFTHGLGGIFLEAWLSGGRRYTTQEAVERFLQRVNEARNAKRSQQDPEETADEVAENGREAKKALAGMGI